jgi:integrase
VTDAEYDAVYKLASERMRIAMDLALLTGQRRGDLLTLTRAKLTDEGIVFNQSKTGAGVLVEWTDELRKITDRAKALKPQVPGEYLLRKRSGRPYTAGDSPPSGRGSWTKPRLPAKTARRRCSPSDSRSTI